jgi:hypothetical protein
MKLLIMQSSPLRYHNTSLCLGKNVISLPPSPDWPPPSLLFNGAFSLGVKWPEVKLTTRLHLVPRLRMCEAVPPLPNISSWCGA